MARLMPLSVHRSPTLLGLLKGQIEIGPDFDDPLPEEIASVFRGEGA
jgi:hypothetical protein